jgi:hypothetical protein
VKADIGWFAFQEGPCAYRYPIAFAFHPNDYKQPRILILDVLAIGAQRFGAKDANFVNRVSHRETAAQVTDILQARPFGELKP